MNVKIDTETAKNRCPICGSTDHIVSITAYDKKLGNRVMRITHCCKTCFNGTNETWPENPMIRAERQIDIDELIPKRGGKRVGAGRPAGEKTTMVRVPKSMVPAVKTLLWAYRGLKPNEKTKFCENANNSDEYNDTLSGTTALIALAGKWPTETILHQRRLKTAITNVIHKTD